MPGGPTVGLLASAAVVWVLAQSTRRETVAMTAVVASGRSFRLGYLLLAGSLLLMAACFRLTLGLWSLPPSASTTAEAVTPSVVWAWNTSTT